MIRLFGFSPFEQTISCLAKPYALRLIIRTKPGQLLTGLVDLHGRSISILHQLYLIIEDNHARLNSDNDGNDEVVLFLCLSLTIINPRFHGLLWISGFVKWLLSI